VNYGSRKHDWLLKQQFWIDCTFLYKSGFWQNFAMTSPENSYMKNVTNELRFLVVTHTTCFDIRFGRYDILKSGFSSGQILDRLGVQVLDQVFWPKDSETPWDLNTSSEVNKLSFPMPSQTHVFDNCSNGYGRLSTAHVRSPAGR
jgi:hypothetical protein